MFQQANLNVFKDARDVILLITEENRRIGKILILHHQRAVEEVLQPNV